MAGTVCALLLQNEMKLMYPIKTKQHNGFIYGLACLCLSVACLFALTSNAFAATDADEAEDSYVDSVYNWGAWELGLEPASGPQPASRALNNRSRTLQFRPNDNAAFIPESIEVPPVTTFSPPPPLPVMPPTIPSTATQGAPGAIPGNGSLR